MPRPRLRLADGTTISVQASASHMCEPREDVGPYSHVEVGFPSARPEPWGDWEDYAEWKRFEMEPESPENSIYCYVPIEMVWQFILDHGSTDAVNKTMMELES